MHKYFSTDNCFCKKGAENGQKKGQFRTENNQCDNYAVCQKTGGKKAIKCYKNKALSVDCNK